MRRIIRLLAASVTLTVVLSACGGGGGGSGPSTAFTVSYDSNGGSGTIVDSGNPHHSGDVIYLSDGTGFTKSGSVFNGWNTQANGSGTSLLPADTYSPTGDVTFYAQWVASGTKFSVSYNANQGSNAVPLDANSPYAPLTLVTVLPNTYLTRSGYTFSGWNTQANGTGTARPAGATFKITGDVTLYAQWTLVSGGGGSYLYVVNHVGNTVVPYKLGTDGKLTKQTSTSTGNYPSGIGVDASHTHLYVANAEPSSNNGTVSQFTIGADGNLTDFTPPTVPAGFRSMPLAVNGSFVYVLNEDATLSQYAISASGGLTALAPATVPTDPAASTILFSGSTAYVLNYKASSTISLFTVAANGALTTLGSPVAAGSWANSMAINGSHAYVPSSRDNAIYEYSIGAGGSLTPIGSYTMTGPVTITTATTSGGAFAYVTATDYNIYQLKIGADGTLAGMTPASVSTTNGNPADAITVDPTGRFFYASGTLGGNYGWVSLFSIDASTGQLTFQILYDTHLAGWNPIGLLVVTK
jgi:6-phosphogluconolactonase